MYSALILLDQGLKCKQYKDSPYTAADTCADPTKFDATGKPSFLDPQHSSQHLFVATIMCCSLFFNRLLTLLPQAYFATIVCARIRPVLEAWAVVMFILTALSITASFSGCCLNGCCNCKETFDGETIVVVTQGQQMAPIPR